MMSTSALAALSLAVGAYAQGAGKLTPETHPKLTTQTCTASGCTVSGVTQTRAEAYKLTEVTIDRPELGHARCQLALGTQLFRHQLLHRQHLGCHPLPRPDDVREELLP